ncbi:tetranectin-like [Oncorhynchus keta]|uniref:tetranectin-like n=1 Tax=Oncorhynchus keta TaxID=8018 RepID=UPI0015FB42B8|nr:tetranectin-like [Oncorhynchus keta]
MEFRRTCLVFGILLLVNCSFQQAFSTKKMVKKDEGKGAAIEELQKQINDIVQDLNIMKEQQALQSVCLKGVKVHGKCFLAEPLKKSYHTAFDDCIALGGVLGTPLSKDQNDQLSDYVHQSIGPGEQIWLGISDMVTEGNWIDQTGNRILYKNWDSDSRSPKTDRSQNCVILSEATGGKWLDKNCREEKASVCEFNIV